MVHEKHSQAWHDTSPVDSSDLNDGDYIVQEHPHANIAKKPQSKVQRTSKEAVVMALWSKKDVSVPLNLQDGPPVQEARPNLGHNSP